jgi:hypothetical protein
VRRRTGFGPGRIENCGSRSLFVSPVTSGRCARRRRCDSRPSPFSGPVARASPLRQRCQMDGPWPVGVHLASTAALTSSPGLNEVRRPLPGVTRLCRVKTPSSSAPACAVRMTGSPEARPPWQGLGRLRAIAAAGWTGASGAAAEVQRSGMETSGSRGAEHARCQVRAQALARVRTSGRRTRRREPPGGRARSEGRLREGPGGARGSRRTPERPIRATGAPQQREPSPAPGGLYRRSARSATTNRASPMSAPGRVQSGGSRSLARCLPQG